MDNIDEYDSTIKKIKKMFFVHNGGQGSKIAYRTSIDDKNDWSKVILQLDKNDTGTESANTEGRNIQFRIFGSSVGEPFSYGGYEVLQGTTELITFK